jgi:SAM-dependent methyltransferase
MLNLNDFFIKGYLARRLAKAGRVSVLLDVGCGKAPYHSLYEQYASKVILTDREPRAPALSVVGDAQHLPFADHVCDCIVLTEVVEHLKEPESALKEAARVLKGDGLLLLTWPLHYEIHDVPEDYARYTEFGMARLLEEAGFALEEIQRRGDLFSVIHTVLAKPVQLSLEAVRRVPFLGFLARPFCDLSDWLIELSFRVHHAVAHGFKRNWPLFPGDRLRGSAWSLSRWTLGYCAAARKGAAKTHLTHGANP